MHTRTISSYTLTICQHLVESIIEVFDQSEALVNYYGGYFGG